MDETQRRRFADGYRQMPDEKLSDLLAGSSSLTDEARQALHDVIDERPDPAAIRATAEDKAVPAAPMPTTRPGLGFWLGFLVFGFCVAPVRAAIQTFNQLAIAEQQYPQILEMGPWKIYKGFSWLLVAGIVAACVIAVNAIFNGTTRRDRNRILGALWFNALGITLLDLAATTVLFGREVAVQSLADQQYRTQTIIAVVFAGLWSAYLTRSDRCKRRYPARNADDAIADTFN